MSNRIFLSSPTMHGDEQKFITEAFETNWIAPLGPNVDGFEREIAEYVGIKHAAALVSGTSALHLAVKLAGVKRGNVVFSPLLSTPCHTRAVYRFSLIPRGILGTWIQKLSKRHSRSILIANV